MSFESLRLITLDVTNTLLKFRTPPWQYYVLVAKDHGFTGTEDDVKTKLNINIKDMWRKYPNYGKSSISYENWWSQVVKMTLQDHLPKTADLENIANTLMNEFKTSKCWAIADGGNELLNLIKKHNIPLGVISNFDPRLNEILKNLQLYDKFDFIVTSYEVGYSKPDQEIFKTAIKMSKKDIKPYEALHIGDDLEKDYRGARAAGWHALLINSNITSENPPPPHCLFNNLGDLCSAIKQKRLRL